MTNPSLDCVHRVRKPETDSATKDSATTGSRRCRDGGNAGCTDPVLRVLAFDGSPQSMAVLLLAVEREIPAFDLALHLHMPRERSGIAAEPARVLHVAVSAGVPVLRITPGQCPDEAIARKIREILGYSPGSVVSAGTIVELAIAASLDDLHVATASQVPFIRHCFPLLDLGWGHRECQAYLRSLRQENTTRARRLRRGWSL